MIAAEENVFLRKKISKNGSHVKKYENSKKSEKPFFKEKIQKSRRNSRSGVSPLLQALLLPVTHGIAAG